MGNLECFPYRPPAVWQPRELKGSWGRESLKVLSGQAWTERPLPVGKHPLQLYSIGTPNGNKVTILLEELGVEYDAWLVNIQQGEQYSSGFLEVNPNAHIPCMVDHSDHAGPIKIFDSGAMLLHLAEKYGRFMPTSQQDRAECMSWLFWQASGGPAFGMFNIYFFYSDDHDKHQNSIDRFALEVKRQLTVLNGRLRGRKFICGEEPTIADFAVFPWARNYQKRQKVAEFVSLHEYTEIIAWMDRLMARPAVQRGLRVNAPSEKGGLKERHSRKDLDVQNTEDASAPPGMFGSRFGL